MKIKNAVIGIAIIILTIFVAVYGTHTFYKQPEYIDFCGEYKTQEVIETQAQCEAIGGQWNSYGNIPKPANEEPTGYCDRDFTCGQEYETANEKYSRNIFLIALPLGLILIAIGVITFGLETVGAGLAGGGVGIIIWGIGKYWQYGSNLLKFLLSLVGLIFVILIAYYFNRKTEKRR